MELDEVIADWASPILAHMDERPIWQGGASGEITYRFFFMGNSCRVTSIRLWKSEISTRYVVKMLNRCEESAQFEVVGDGRIWKQDQVELQSLMDASDMWRFRAGNWNDPEEVYLDCTTLLMERAAASEYNFSRVEISCNQPRKLMPLVNKIVALVGLSPGDVGYLDADS
jgi:hypothetical protein